MPAHEKIQIYSAPYSMFGMKVEIAALEKHLAFDIEMVPYSREKGYFPKHPEVLRINPKGQVPVLTHGQTEIFDSTQIFEYLELVAPTPALWPDDISARTRARQLEHASDEIFFPLIIKLMGLQNDLNGEAAMSARKGALAFYDEFEAVLQDKSFLAGTYSYADIAFFMAQVFAERLGAPMTAATPKLMTWREHMLARPAVHSVMQTFVTTLQNDKRPVPDFLVNRNETTADDGMRHAR